MKRGTIMVEINTRIFGKIAVEDDKIIRFDKGILGFPDLKDFTLIFKLCFCSSIIYASEIINR